jgi:hypothetical protein
MSAEKEFLDLSDSSASRKLNAGEIHWVPLHFDKVHRIDRANVHVSVKWAIILFQTLLQSNPKLPNYGFAVDDRGPISIAAAARLLGVREPKFRAGINTAIDLGFIGKMDAEVLYDPWLVKDKKARDYRKTSSNDEKRKNQPSSNDDSPKNPKNGHSSRGNGDNNRSKTQPLKSDTVQYKDSSRLKGDYWTTDEHPTPARNCAGADANINGQTKTAPSSLAWAANDSELEADLNKLSAEFPTLNVREEFSIWLERCGKDNHAPTREWFEGFLRLAVKHAERQSAAQAKNGNATPAKKRKRSAAPAKDADDNAATAAAEKRAREAEEARRTAENERWQAEQAAIREAEEARRKAEESKALTAEAEKLKDMPALPIHAVRSWIWDNCGRDGLKWNAILCEGKRIGSAFVNDNGVHYGSNHAASATAANNGKADALGSDSTDF